MIREISMKLIYGITSFDWTDGCTPASLGPSPAPRATHEETTMTPNAVPSRITIDFRDAAMPSRTWILGVDEASSGRMELIAFDAERTRPDAALPHRAGAGAAIQPDIVPVAVFADCACPDFCERDHENE
jgi:hypothetical protein